MDNKIVLDSETVIHIINHAELIKDSYKHCCKASELYYTLKPEVFNYKRNSKDEVCEKDSRKRKKKLETHNKIIKDCNTTNHFLETFEDEVSKLKNIVDDMLAKQQNSVKEMILEYKNLDDNLDLDIEAITSECHLPKGSGENITNDFQIVSINGNHYIIPPKSRYYSYNIEQISELNFIKPFDLIIIDPPWRNKYIRRLKKSNFKSSASYKMLNNEQIQDIPVKHFIHKDSLVIIWCTNSHQHQSAVLDKFLPSWNLKLVSKYFWVKLAHAENRIDTICEFNPEFGKKQPFEIFFVACSKHSEMDFSEIKNKFNIIMSVPSIVHSHKPPVVEIFKKILRKDFECMELFARYLQPNFTSIGLEVLKLMDYRLYKKEKLEDR